MEDSINSAIKKGYFKQVRYLIKFGYNINERDEEGKTPLIHCALVEDFGWGVGLARSLLEKGANLKRKDKYGLNALHYACLYENIELVKVFLDCLDFALSAGDLQGNTALHYAAASGNIDILRLLVDAHLKYKISVDKPNKKGVTPLIQAWKSGQITCGRFLVDIGEADELMKDHVFFKTAREWEEDMMDRMRSQELYRLSHPNARAMTRSATSFYNNESNFNRSRARVQSAQVVRRRHAQDQVNNSINNNAEIIEKGMLPIKQIRTASEKDLRNKPEYILQISPIECFVNNRLPIRARSAKGYRSLDVSSFGSNHNWRGSMRSMYTDYDFQFSKSFTKCAKPIEETNSLLSPRTLSPNPSDCGTESSNRRSPSRNDRKSTHSLKGNSLDKPRSRISSASPRSRRTSALSPPNIKHTDSSSNESVNSSQKLTKRKSEIKDDVSDADTGSNVISDQTRPVSRASHHLKQDSGSKVREKSARGNRK